MSVLKYSSMLHIDMYYTRFELCEIKIKYCCIQIMKNITVLIQTVADNIILLSNNRGLKEGPTFYGASSGSKLVAKVIDSLQNTSIAGNEFSVFCFQ